MLRIITGEYRNRKIKVPEGLDVRPTTNQMREAVFNICQHLVEGARFLDIFAGSGAMGFEALSRGAAHATFIDSGKSSIRCINDNAKALSVEANCSILSGDAIKTLQQMERRGERFSLIYIDPPYDSNLYQALLKIFDEGNLVAPGGRVFIESAFKSKIDLPQEGLKSLIFCEKRRYGIAELFEYRRKE